jgi:hypothetical protein
VKTIRAILMHWLLREFFRQFYDADCAKRTAVLANTAGITRELWINPDFLVSRINSNAFQTLPVHRAHPNAQITATTLGITALLVHDSNPWHKTRPDQ